MFQRIREAFVAADELSAPLGQEPKAKWLIKLPFRWTHGVAGLLGFCLIVFAGWAVFANDPLGGEPIVIVSADPRAPAPSAPGAKPAEPAHANPAPAAEASAASADKGVAPAASGQTVTVIDGMT